jgi:hypothetical protein
MTEYTYGTTYNYLTPEQDKPIEHRGFKIKRVQPYYLYRITPRDGYALWRSLDGSFTTAEIATKQIDNWYQECSWAASAGDAYIPLDEKPKRGRPTKKQQLARALEANSLTS